MVLDCKLIIIRLKTVFPEGLEVSTRKGMMTNTYALFMRDATIYKFKMLDDFAVEPHLTYSEDAFINEFDGIEWTVRRVIKW